jgi:pimeloyl-ACP methyl ester carboxylesterase
MWRYGAWLADAGWHATAVDLRGHGTAPRALDYTIDAYASDVLHTAAPDGEPWDLVIGHSLGGAAAPGERGDPGVDAATRPDRPGDPPLRPRPHRRGQQPAALVRRHLPGAVPRRAPALASSRTSS